MKYVLACLFLLGICSSKVLSSPNKVSGYLYSPESIDSSLSGTGAVYGQTITDGDLQGLVSHNLGVLNQNDQLSESSKDVISNFGAKNMMSQQKMNYMFLVETENDKLVNVEKLAKNKRGFQHNSANFEICGQNVDGCILDLMYSEKTEKSVLKALQNNAQREKVEAFYYSTDLKTAGAYINNLLALQAHDGEEQLLILDNSSNKFLKVKKNIKECVNDFLAHEFKYNKDERTITPLDRNVKIFDKIQVDAQHTAQLNQFMEDMCSIVSISSFIRKEDQPSMFTFYITSLKQLEKSLPNEQLSIFYHIFNVAYLKFVQNIRKHYNNEEISGQVLLLNPDFNLSEKYENVAPTERKLPATNLIQTRILQKGKVIDPVQAQTSVIYKSVLIIFALVNLWVWAEMFQMGYSRDSIVYAKFLAADYFKK